MYYEKYEIKEAKDGVVEGTKRVTIKTSEKEEVSFDVPEWELATVMTEEPSDAGEARNKRAIILVDEIYELLLNRKARVEEIGFVIQKLITKLKGTEESAINNMFGVADKNDIRLNIWQEKANLWQIEK